MPDELKFVSEPPPSKRGARPGKWSRIADQLREHPGQWAQVAEGTYSTMVNNIKKGNYSGMEPGEFEAVSRNTHDGKCDVWARYVGEE